MTDDLQERLRRSLATRADDVRPDAATWARVEARIRRRAWARWSLAGLTAAAVLAVAALTLPGILNGARVDLSPADPPPPAGATTLVTTDGQRLHITDPDGGVLDEIEPPVEAGDPLPITRVAVRPGSTPDDLTVVYLRADASCERVEMGWVTANADGTVGGALGGGQGFCMTDPVWVPGGGTVAWVERAPDGAHTLHAQRWGAHGPGEQRSDDALAVPGVGDLRAIDWWGERAGPGFLSLSGTRTDGTAQGFVVPVVQGPDGRVQVLYPEAEADPVPDGVVMRVFREEEASYELGVGEDGTVELTRVAPMAADQADPQARGGVARSALPLGPGTLAAEHLRTGTAWLSARGDTVAFGAEGDAWVVGWEVDGWGGPTPLPGVVHAAVLAPAADEPAPEGPAPGGPERVATEGNALTLTAADGQTVLTESVDQQITDFAVHPDSTPEDLTVVWREGTGCGATLRYTRVVAGEVAGGGTVTAECPGRPVFSPDGGHLVWVADTGATGGGEFSLETVPWSDGPGESVTIFGLPANPAEITRLTVLDWVWADGTGTARTGHLLLAGTDGHGTVSALTAPIERQGDGELALPAGAVAGQVTPFEFAADQDRFAVLQAGSGADRATAPLTYTLETRVRDGAEDDLAVVPDLDGDEADHAFVLPSGLLRVNTTGEVDAVWMTARGSDVLLGDGAGRVFSLRWTGGGWSELSELDTRARYAVPLGGSPTRPPEPGTDPSPPPPVTEAPVPAPPEPQPDPEPDTQGLPSPVADTRLAIVQAARAGDVEALAGLTGDGFTSSFGGPEDPLAFFTRLRDAGELDRLVRILELPHGEQGGIYSWPFAYTRDMESLSSAELELLSTIATQEEIDSWFAFGGYAGWRAGIDAEGTWRFYVAGD